MFVPYARAAEQIIEYKTIKIYLLNVSTQIGKITRLLKLTNQKCHLIKV